MRLRLSILALLSLLLVALPSSAQAAAPNSACAAGVDPTAFERCNALERCFIIGGRFLKMPDRAVAREEVRRCARLDRSLRLVFRGAPPPFTGLSADDQARIAGGDSCRPRFTAGTSYADQRRILEKMDRSTCGLRVVSRTKRLRRSVTFWILYRQLAS